MKRNASLLGAAAVLAGCFTAAHAATVGTLTCTAENKQLQVAVGYFNFGVTEVTSTTSSTTTAVPLLDVHAALSQFGPFYEAAGKKISSCDLRATLAYGTVAEFKFTGISLYSVTAIARSPRTSTDTPALFTDAQIQYSAVKVVSSGGSDDGGTDGGWYKATSAGTGPTTPGSQ